MSVVLSGVMIFSLLLTGCGGNKEKESTNPQTSEKAADKTPTPEPRITLTMFMGNSGLAHPQGVDPNNNYMLDIIKKNANVDLQLEVPNYQDFQTKLNLLLSSGNLPDLVHSWYTDDMTKRGDEGAFIDLKKYYDNSKPVQKYITSEMMEIAKTASGKNFRIPMAWAKAPQGNAVFARYDIVKKYTNNKWPESVDEWLDVMRKIHKDHPDWIVMSNRVVGDTGLGYGGTPIYYWYGAMPFAIRYEYDTGKVVSTFVLPEYKAATKIMKQLYDEGILDKEFATNDNAKWFDKKLNKNVLFEVNTLDQYIPNVQATSKTNKDTPQVKDWESFAAPQLTKLPAEVKDPIYTIPYKSTPISGHGLYISSKCKTPDRAWKVIEAFACDELYNAVFWGREGSEHKVENGKKVPVPEKLTAQDFRWTLQYALIFGFVEGQEVKKAIGDALLDKAYCDTVNKGIDAVDAAARKKGISPADFVVKSEEAKKKSPEVNAYITNATIEAIMGKITMDQFDQKVKDFQTKYGFIYDEYTKYVKDNKDAIAKKGSVFTK